MSKPYGTIPAVLPHVVKEVLAAVEHSLVACLFKLVAEGFKYIVQVVKAHAVFLEIGPLLPVESDREIRLSAVESLNYPACMFTDLFFSVISRVEVHSNVKTCRSSFLHVPVVVVIKLDLAVVVTHSHYYELNSCFLYRIVVHVGLPRRYIDAEPWILVAVGSLEVRKVHTGIIVRRLRYLAEHENFQIPVRSVARRIGNYRLDGVVSHLICIYVALVCKYGSLIVVIRKSHNLSKVERLALLRIGFPARVYHKGRSCIDYVVLNFLFVASALVLKSDLYGLFAEIGGVRFFSLVL